MLSRISSGLRAELRDRYKNGHSVCTTVVHPSWHDTGILGGKENVKRLNDFGIYPEPASNVSDLVLENVLKGKSGQIFVPKDQVRNSKMRTYPIWVQDAIYGLMGLAMKAKGGGKSFEFGKDDTFKL